MPRIAGIFRRICLPFLALAFALAARAAEAPAVEQWGMFEIALPGPAEGNPFTEVEISADFTHAGRTVRVPGFYDGEGVYKIRFMPDTQGEWSYRTTSNRPELSGRTGTFTATPPAPGNHGPVRVANTFHFAYADGTPFKELGTTCYYWTHQPDAQQALTLQTLAAAPFNKLRLCVFPPEQTPDPLRYYPFEGHPPDRWDTTRFNPEFFRQLERLVAGLRDLGIEADVILFHPYNKASGFNSMDAVSDDRYVRYVVARLSAYRNVWWSLANEYDLVRDKQESDWDRLGVLVQSADPHQHLRSIHHSMQIYNNTLPWVTHASMQNGAAVLDPERAVLYRDVYRKPVVYDEVKYEGAISRRWGQLSAEDLVLRFWTGMVAGTYVGHGEIFTEDGRSWLAAGGQLRGQSIPHLAFLKGIMAGSPPAGIEPIDKWQERRMGGQAGEYYLVYLGRKTPREWPFVLPKTNLANGMKFKVDVIDTWNMTITPVDGVFEIIQRNAYDFADKDGRSISLPGLPYQAIRIRRQH